MDTSSPIPQLNPSSPFALLENSRAQQGEEASLLFWGALQHITAHDEASLHRAFEQLESHRRAGHFLCGYMTYEAGYLLADKKGMGLSKLKEGSLPLLSFFSFSHCERLDREQVSQWLRAAGDGAPCAIHGLELDESEPGYCSKIERIRRYIREGDTYQVNYTLKYRFDFDGEPLDLYRELRERQTVEYGSYLNFPEVRVVSLSPELFIRKDGERIMSKPMKGTAKRGATAQEDQAIVQALREDPKTISENVMIVDLLRNDIGRLARPGSVRVRDLFEIQTFQTVHQMISTVEGTVDPEVTIGEVFRQLFPCGSITGAPKLRTMEIIEQLEEAPRGIYTGAIGYITPQNDFCFSVPIRTIVSREDSRAELGIGSGIIHEAVATAEFSECLLKARFLTGLNEKFQLIESLRFSTRQAAPEHLKQHMTRLERSARLFGFTWEPAHVLEAVREATEAASEGTYKLRLLLHHDGRVSVTLTPLTEEASSRRWLMLSSERVSSESVFQYHKTTMRAHYERAFQEASAAGAYDVLFLNERNEIAETARHNLFLEKGGELLTPPVSAGILNGIQRGLILGDPARKAREASLTLEDLVRADKIFLTNSVRGMVEVELLPAQRDSLLSEGKLACSV
jgi:para-aminobenzoate synthetase / 4-amino-4-deoxychorismate lyase